MVHRRGLRPADGESGPNYWLGYAGADQGQTNNTSTIHNPSPLVERKSSASDNCYILLCPLTYPTTLRHGDEKNRVRSRIGTDRDQGVVFGILHGAASPPSSSSSDIIIVRRPPASRIVGARHLRREFSVRRRRRSRRGRDVREIRRRRERTHRPRRVPRRGPHHARLLPPPRNPVRRDRVVRVAICRVRIEHVPICAEVIPIGVPRGVRGIRPGGALPHSDAQRQPRQSGGEGAAIEGLHPGNHPLRALGVLRRGEQQEGAAPAAHGELLAGR